MTTNLLPETYISLLLAKANGEVMIRRSTRIFFIEKKIPFQHRIAKQGDEIYMVLSVEYHSSSRKLRDNQGP
jgi:hypothetical protein